MMGFSASRRGGRLPSFAIVALAVLVLFISFNYWDVSSQRGRLLDELAEAQAQAKRTDAARSRLEKRGSELMAQVEAQRKEIDREEGALRGSMQVLEGQVKKCNDEKMKMQSDSLSQVSEIQRLKEQLKELKDEYMKQEGLLQELKKNRTSMEKKLELESLQCKQKINQLNDEYLQKQRILEEEAFRLRKNLPQNRAVATINKADGDSPKLSVYHPDIPDTKGVTLSLYPKELSKLAVDAGVPGAEDSDLGKARDAPFAVRKPAITWKQVQHVGDGPAKELGHADTLGSKVKLETEMERVAAGAGDGVNDVPQDQGPMGGKHADVQAGLQGQLPAPDRMKVAALDDKREGLQVAPNPAQALVKPMENEAARNPHPVQILDEGQHAVDDGRHQAVDIL